MSRQANADPTIGPTLPARSRTTSVLSPAAAPAVPASNALNKKKVKRAVFANLREAKVTFDTVPVNPASAAPVASGKRFACQTASQGMRGQEQKDQMQLCMAQAHLDCLKQAIDQKIVGPQRKEFVKSCAQ